MTVERLTLRDAPEEIRKAAVEAVEKGKQVAWSELVGFHLSAESRERDAGVTVTKMIGTLGTDDLLDLRYTLRDTYGTRPRGEKETPTEAVVDYMVELIEHEVAGRWAEAH